MWTNLMGFFYYADNLKETMIQILNKGAMLDFNSSLERYNSNDYRTPFIFILILRTVEQNEMSKARRLLVIQREGKPRRDLRSILLKSTELLF